MFPCRCIFVLQELSLLVPRIFLNINFILSIKHVFKIRFKINQTKQRVVNVLMLNVMAYIVYTYVMLLTNVDLC